MRISLSKHHFSLERDIFCVADVIYKLVDIVVLCQKNFISGHSKISLRHAFYAEGSWNYADRIKVKL